MGSSPIADASSNVVVGRPANTAVTSISHVVVIFQENHSFDNVLGGLCVTDRLDCDGTTSGVLHTGRRTRLAAAPDIVPNVQHKIAHQRIAINGGRMNGFDLIPGCSSYARRCYTQYGASQIPNLRSLAEHFVISDRTFSEDPIPSWGLHLELVAGQLGGFQGAGPTDDAGSLPKDRGWGCDSHKDSPWKDPTNPRSRTLMVPSCIPRTDGFGPYRPSPVRYIPTILDRLTSARLAWRIYADTAATESGYLWSICPTFASCFYDPRRGGRPSAGWQDRSEFIADASAGELPAYSAIMPSYELSQHNNASMRAGDNYIASLVDAVMNGPPAQWESTVIFITYDDCGCFYDHVPPPLRSGLGIRVPMVIVSPQAKAAFVDHTQASFNSMLAFVEKNWRLRPLTADDAHAYDYCRSFVFTSLPCTGAAAGTTNTTARAAPRHVRLQQSRVPEASLRYTRAHPTAGPDDPT